MNALLAHGGGPTSVINASLAGLVETTRANHSFDKLYGARMGVQGILSADFVDLLGCPPSLIEAARNSPGSLIGTSRRKLEEADYQALLDNFDKHRIQTFFYTGGNGSMDTALRVESHARQAGYPLQVIGIPKTIDNDLHETDHTPGYISTAHFFAAAAHDVGEDNRSLPSPVCVLEVLGRNVGWVAAATALARHYPDDAPHLIYFPERPLSLNRIAADVEHVYAKLGRVVIAVCEGQLDENGVPFGADVDRAGSSVHRLASNLGHTLARLITEKLGIRARSEKPGLFGRCSGAFATELDRREAFECGGAAAEAAMNGESAVMIAIKRVTDEPYQSVVSLTPLKSVARRERTIPLDWINDAGNDVAPAFLDYLTPLMPKLQYYARL